MVAGRTAILTTASTWHTDIPTAAMASWDAKWVLKTLQALEQEAERLAPDLRKDLAPLRQELQKIHQQSRAAPKIRQAALHEARYRSLHAASLVSRRGRTLGDGATRLQRPPTHELYEKWCVRALVEELAPPGDRPRLLRRLLGDRTQSATIHTRSGRATLRLQYELAVPALEGARGKPRPDFLIELEDPKKIIIFDAKYRVHEDMVRAPLDAVDGLHLYRDLYLLHRPAARHKQVWAAILYPAPGLQDQPDAWLPLFRSGTDEKVRVGAVPLSPSVREPLRDYLQKLGCTA